MNPRTLDSLEPLLQNTLVHPECDMKHDLGGWEIIKTDVLVIGGGFGGLWSAIRAAECDCTVTLVDKSFAGKSGHSFFASGAMMVMLPGDDLQEHVADVVSGNEWLVDQEMVKAVFEGSYDRLKDFESMGIHFRKNKGEYVWTRARGTRNIKNLWPENGSAAEEVTTLRKIAIQKGVRILDHVYVYDLLKDRAGAGCGSCGLRRQRLARLSLPGGKHHPCNQQRRVQRASSRLRFAGDGAVSGV